MFPGKILIKLLRNASRAFDDLSEMMLSMIINQADLFVLDKNDTHLTITDPHNIGLYYILRGQAKLVFRV